MGRAADDLFARALVLGGPGVGKSELLQLLCGQGGGGSDTITLVDPLHSSWSIQLAFFEVPSPWHSADLRYLCANTSTADCALLVVDTASAASLAAAEERARWASEAGIRCMFVLSTGPPAADPRQVTQDQLEALAERISAVQPAHFDLSAGACRDLHTEIFLDVLAVRIAWICWEEQVSGPPAGEAREEEDGAECAVPRCASMIPERYKYVPSDGGGGRPGTPELRQRPASRQGTPGRAPRTPRMAPFAPAQRGAAGAPGKTRLAPAHLLAPPGLPLAARSLGERRVALAHKLALPAEAQEQKVNFALANKLALPVEAQEQKVSFTGAGGRPRRPASAERRAASAERRQTRAPPAQAPAAARAPGWSDPRLRSWQSPGSARQRSPSWRPAGAGTPPPPRETVVSVAGLADSALKQRLRARPARPLSAGVERGAERRPGSPWRTAARARAAVLFEVEMDLGGGRVVPIRVQRTDDVDAVAAALAREEGLTEPERRKVAHYLRRLSEKVTTAAT